MGRGAFSRVCVECGRPLGPQEALYDVHGPGNVELLKCVHCGQVRDRFVEYDAFLLLLDLLLLHPPAYRHCIFNHFAAPREAQGKGSTAPVSASAFLLRACPALLLTQACLSLSVATFRSREEWGSQGIPHFLHQPLHAHRHWLLALGGLFSAASLTYLFLLFLTFPWPSALTRPGGEQGAGQQHEGQPAASVAALALVLGDAPKLLAFSMLVWPYPPVLIYALCCLAAASSCLSFNVLLSSNMGGAASFGAALLLAGSRLAVELLGLTRVYRNSFWECRAQEL